MKSKKTKSIKNRDDIAKIVTLVFKDKRDGFTRTINEEALEQMLYSMIRLIKEDENIIKMDDVLEYYGMIRKDFERIREKYPQAQETHEYCMMMLGNRRERGGLTNKLNAGFIERSMPLYDPSYKKLMDDKLNKLANNPNTGFIVQMASIPSSELVPEKKED